MFFLCAFLLYKTYANLNKMEIVLKFITLEINVHYISYRYRYCLQVTRWWVMELFSLSYDLQRWYI